MPYKDPIKKKAYLLRNKENILASRRRWYFKNKKQNTMYVKEWAKNNKDKRLEYQKKWAEKHGKEYRTKNLERDRAREHKRYTEDICFALKKTLRVRIGKALKNKQKRGSAIDDLGCSVPELKIYLEKQFKEGMSWSNWGLYGWHIDHRLPLDYFDLTDRRQFLEATHYTNLQPMWATENIRKGNKVDWVDLKNPIYHEATLITKPN